jgi:hypothetical protein
MNCQYNNAVVCSYWGPSLAKFKKHAKYQPFENLTEPEFYTNLEKRFAP